MGGVLSGVVRNCRQAWRCSDRAPVWQAHELGRDRNRNDFRPFIAQTSQADGAGDVAHFCGRKTARFQPLAESGPFGFAANLKIVEVPDDVNWEVVQYDGLEHIAEKHRTWY